MKDFFKVLYKYILQYRLVCLVFLLFGGIFMGTFSLYRLEIEAVFYACILCGICGLVILSIHFIAYYKKHCELVTIGGNIELPTAMLPPPANLIEEDLNDIIADLQRINAQILTEQRAERRESIDYYTTWVHQIKAPIAAMRLMLQGEDTEENKELLAELFRIEQYTEMVLCYFRLDSSSSDFVIQQNDLDQIIRQAIRKFAAQFVRKKISLSYEKTDIKALTDSKWLLFILEQLLSNAIKYTETGSITISVSQPKTNSILLSVKDTGIGIAEEDLPRIFEKGFTGYNGHTSKMSTGLGLYLTKKAANKLSHKISVSSSTQHGTTVTLDLHSDKLEVE